MGTYLITGGAGFIGRRTTKQLLAKGYNVRILDNFSDQIHNEPQLLQSELRSDCEVVVGDVCDYDVVSRSLDGVCGVLHLAAETGVGQSMYEIEKHTMTNIQGTSVLLQALRDGKSRVEKVVLASSRAVYGEGLYRCPECERQVSPPPRSLADLQRGCWGLYCDSCGGVLESVSTREDSKLCPGSVYAASKVSQENLMECVCASLGIRFNSLRYFNVYGEGQALGNPYTGILTTFITQIIGDKQISVYEDGMESRDFVHIDDVACANVLALISDCPEGPFNIGSGNRISILDMAKIISEIWGYQRPPIVTGEFRYGDIRHCVAATERAKDELGFASKIEIEDGLSQFVGWAGQQQVDDKTDIAYKELSEHGLLGVGGMSR